MRFRVSQELRQPVGTEFSLELRERSLLLDDDAAVNNVQGDASLLRTDRGLLVTLRAAARLKGVCSRCLAPLELPIEIDFQEEFIPVVDPLSGTHITSDEAKERLVSGADLKLGPGRSPAPVCTHVAARKAALPAGLRRPVPGLRRQPQRRPMRLPGPEGEPLAGAGRPEDEG